MTNVTRRFPGLVRPAVDHVSLEIESGEFLTFLGPSGSGKTTLLSMIAGFIPLTEGAIFIDGHDVSRLKPHKRNLGVVFQNYALFPHMTVARNIAFPLEQRAMTKAEIARRVDEALTLVHLEAFANRLPKQLSGGQQLRVALARAVVYRPRALLLDEPLGALDRRLRDELQRQIVRMHRELRMTFVFVTHDQQEALTLSDRVAVLNEGRIEQVDAPSAIYDKPTNLFVAQFLGDSNTFHGVVNYPARALNGAQYQLHIPQIDTTLHGRHAAVVVRPERLALDGHPHPIPARYNQVDAIVTDIRQVGSQLQVGLRFTDDTPGTAIRLVGTPLGAVAGDRVTVSWDPEHQAVVPFDNPIAGPAQGIHNATEPSAHQSEHHTSSITPHLTDPVSDLTS